MRARRGVAVAAVAVVGAGTAGGLFFALGTPDAEGAKADPSLPAATDVVTKQDLLDTDEQDGTLGYGDTTSVVNAATGTVTWLPATGRVLRRGDALYRVDQKPVILLTGTLPAYRTLGVGAEGKDVEEFERNLRALGYTGFTVDDAYSSATAVAVAEWQDDLGVPGTGAVAPGDVVYAAGDVRVSAVKLVLGGQAPPGQEALSVTGTARLVTVELDVADQRLARKGASVTVTLPGGQEVAGRVTEVGTVATAAAAEDGQDSGSGDTTVPVTVALTGKVPADAAFDQSPVTVAFTASERKGVLTVPVAALVALREGGYGVQVVSGGSAKYVRVGTGLFADGRVEVTGSGIAEGTRVGVPAS